ncbi:MAG: hypothetical protein DWQ31_21465 [Planctomycetota bacterium]|nr:MAG: hypothetical protein DWQ31_21465 [Planctomycetota bacterium]REJ93673.1 MAG: hypothetical protein DWQ35_10000 [Planctomycetota bacterium]REK25722.1 MAG: hypothetical protein DWQ42_10740 [Planctomycetota bacterium]REK46532.1 MAG: hypothetical protein DWQ46_06565 [Planctomycetota bacterium]
MPSLRHWISLLIAIVALTAATSAEAQRFQPFGPLLGDEFDHDFQIFAPAEFSSFGDGPEPNEGFFLTYDRVHFSSVRSNETPGWFDADWGYGNRVDFGYMTEDDHGWLAEVLSVSQFNNGPDTDTQLNSGELSKQWRLKPLHFGSIVEVFVGGRYSILRHKRTSGNTAVDVDIENTIFGPQAGLKWYKKDGRWTVSAEGRYFYGYNDQNYQPTPLITPGIQQHRWVHAGDIRAEVTYDLTKSFALSLGWEFLYFGNGVARGEALFNNDQDAYFTGVTVGFKVNR